jgi:hypothetical protein
VPGYTCYEFVQPLKRECTVVKVKYFSKLIKRLTSEYLNLRSKNILYLEVGRARLPLWAQRTSIYSESAEVCTRGRLTEIPVRHYFRERYIYRLTDVTLEPYRGDVFSHKGELIHESSNWHPYYPNPLRRRAPKAKKLPREPQPHIFLASWAYFHFLIENLPSFLAAFKEFPESKVVIAAESPRYLLDVIELLNLSPVVVKKQVQIPDLAICSKGNDSGWAHPQDILLLRETFKDYFSSQVNRKAIYVSRDHSTRSPKFEKSLIEILSSAGVQTVFPEELSFTQQISLFSSTYLLIGLHGAGLSNQVWMEPGSHVIEILDEDYFNICYEVLAEVAGHHYRGVLFNSKSINLPNLFSRINDAVRDVQQS